MKKIYTALPSSFFKDGRINEEAIKGFIKYNVEVTKVDGLYVNGSTGEFPMLSCNMKKQLLKTVIENSPKDIDLIAQVGSTSIYETIALGKFAEELGYKTLSIISPYYFKAEFNEMFNYYKEVISQLKADIIPYYIPGLTGVTFSNDQLHQILGLPKVIGIKFSCPNVQQLTEVKNENPTKKVYWGWDEMMVAGLFANVDGFIGSTYGLNGINSRKLINAFENNDIKKVQEMTLNNIDIINRIVGNGLMETIKYAINDYYQVEHGINILPTKPLTEEQKQNAINIRKELND
ncbi:MAG: N-acetylneuraminate lyase [Mycoplasmatales bacterium]|nr:N-acetylneuraminate lyase [Mycoplasmatales bacterium]